MATSTKENPIDIRTSDILMILAKEAIRGSKAILWKVAKAFLTILVVMAFFYLVLFLVLKFENFLKHPVFINVSVFSILGIIFLCLLRGITSRIVSAWQRAKIKALVQAEIKSIKKVGHEPDKGSS